ncbi:MAG: hypothetical protein HYU77_17005 [Betaproteobacteria bacterium]|nr:hypothetical protein [Betaproteobacteria bacterium]
MGWVENKLDYAGDRLEKAIEHAADKLNGVVREGIADAGSELRDVVVATSREVDGKLDKISEELSSQRHFTKSDIKELVDYAAEKIGATMDERIRVMRTEVTGLVQEKVDYLKSEVDAFFIQRQRELARERRRLIANVLIAVVASIAVAAVSYVYHRADAGTTDLFSLFRILFLSLTGGYAVYLVVNLALKYSRMAEHRKDLLFVAARYWGVLRPQSVLGHLAVLLLIALAYGVMLFPEALAQITGAETLLRWLKGLGGPR